MPQHLSARQRAIMRVLWDRGEATVAEVQERLELRPPLAYSTVATMLARMERKGLVRHRPDGRTFVYRPAVTEGEVGRSVVGGVLEEVFGGSPTEMVSQLLESEHVDAEELARIRALVERHAKAVRRHGKGGHRGG